MQQCHTTKTFVALAEMIAFVPMKVCMFIMVEWLICLWSYSYGLPLIITLHGVTICFIYTCVVGERLWVAGCMLFFMIVGFYVDDAITTKRFFIIVLLCKSTFYNLFKYIFCYTVSVSWIEIFNPVCFKGQKR